MVLNGGELMKRTAAELRQADIPVEFHSFIDGAKVFDSSCSAAAKVWFLDKADGFYLKKAPKDSLQKEAAMTKFFHSKGLAAEILAYESLDEDWLLTRRIAGEDCTWRPYLEQPERLCDTIAQLLRQLHETSFEGCPVDRTADYLATARRHHEAKAYDMALFPDNWGYATPEEAWQVVEQTSQYLKTDTLLHGDYCLPNIMLDSWKFSGFIDLDTAGIGDRHVDLFWGAWTLQFNLKTDRYRSRFLDAYGRDNINEELFRTIAAIEVFG